MDLEEMEMLNGTNGTDLISSFPRTLVSLNVIVPLTAIYITIFITAVFLDVAACITVITNRYMQTSKNMYICNVSFSNLFQMIFGLLFEVLHLWTPSNSPHNDSLYTRAGYISEVLSNVTPLTMIVLTLDRYLATFYPVIARGISKRNRAVVFMILIWIFASFFAVPRATGFGFETYEENKNITDPMLWGPGQKMLVISSSVLFATAICLMIIMYTKIILKLRSSTATWNRRGDSHKNVVELLVALALSYFFCSAPYHVYRLMETYGKGFINHTNTSFTVYIALSHLSRVLRFLPAVINPILSIGYSKNFRNALQKTVTCKRTSRSENFSMSTSYAAR